MDLPELIELELPTSGVFAEVSEINRAPARIN